MTLIKSISGIRGTIGGEVDNNLTPLDLVKFASAYGSWIKQHSSNDRVKIVIGRDARLSGAMVEAIVVNSLIALGIDVINLGLSTTPTVELAVPMEGADGGIILTASHNPKQWNALKLLNSKGEFIDAQAGEMILESAANEDFSYAEVDDLGIETKDDSYLQKHIDAVLNLTLVEKEQIAKKGFKVVVDGVNSTGGIFIPALLEQLGVEVVKLYCDPTGHFPHNPEPLEKHLGAIMEAVVTHKADFGIVVDPDVDRLAFISEDGSMFGEEYTLVACADYVLSKTPGSTVSNLSSSRALSDITNLHKGSYTAASVGEVNVVQCMKDTNAIIGGEGNGGIIYPESHYGRDALVGTALFLMLLSEKNIKVSELRASYPAYFMRKDKIELDASIDVDSLLAAVEKRYQHERINTQDGVKIDFENHWVHLRKSNTEPIIRVYTEAKSVAEAETVANAMMDEIKGLV
jgi:phosphomannomutase